MQSSILFSVLGNILQKKSFELYNKHISDELNWKTYSSFMTLRYLTMSTNENVRNIVLDNYSTLEKMPANIQYRWLLNKIPKLNSSFIRYIK